MNNRLIAILGFLSLTSCSVRNEVSPVYAANDPAVILRAEKRRSMPKTIEDKAVSPLNQLFNTDAANADMVLMIRNESDCDFTMHIVGPHSYKIPVAAKKTESIVVEQGNYEMRSEVCKSPYYTHKTFSENTLLSIRYTVVKNVDTIETVQ